MFDFILLMVVFCSVLIAVQRLAGSYCDRVEEENRQWWAEYRRTTKRYDRLIGWCD